MHVDITKDLAAAVGLSKLKPFGVDLDRLRWNSQTVDLRRLPTNQVRQLRALVEPHRTVKGIRLLMRDLDTWISAAEHGASNVKCKGTKQFASLVFEWLQKQNLHWLFKKDTERECWRAFYVAKVQFFDKRTDRDGVDPAHTDLTILSMELGIRVAEYIHMEDSDARSSSRRLASAALSWRLGDFHARSRADREDPGTLLQDRPEQAGE